MLNGGHLPSSTNASRLLNNLLRGDDFYDHTILLRLNLDGHHAVGPPVTSRRQVEAMLSGPLTADQFRVGVIAVVVAN